MSRGQRYGHYQEETWLIDIIGDSNVNGRIIREKLSDKGLNFDKEEFNSFINFKLKNGVISYSHQDDNRLFFMDAFIDSLENDYCLTKEYLRNWKLKELGV